MPVFSDQTKHGALSLASLALMTSLVLPQAYATNAVVDPLPNPPPAGQEVNPADFQSGPLIENLANMSFHEAVSYKGPQESKQTEKPQAREEDPSNSSGLIGWAIAGSMAAWKFGQQLLTQLRTTFSKQIIEKGKSLLSSKMKKELPGPGPENASISLILIEDGKRTAIPFKPDSLKEFFTNEETLNAFLAAFNKCNERNCFPQINLTKGQKRHTYLKLRDVNEAFWDTLSTYFTTNPKEFLASPKSAKREYVILSICRVSEDPSEGKSLEILLVKKDDFLNAKAKMEKEDEKVIRAARRAQEIRLKYHPDKPLFMTLAV